MFSEGVIDLVSKPDYDVLAENMEYESKDSWMRVKDYKSYHSMVRELRP